MVPRFHVSLPHEQHLDRFVTNTHYVTTSSKGTGDAADEVKALYQLGYHVRWISEAASHN